MKSKKPDSLYDVSVITMLMAMICVILFLCTLAVDGMNIAEHFLLIGIGISLLLTATIINSYGKKEKNEEKMEDIKSE